MVAKTAIRKNRIQSLLRPCQQLRVGAHQQREGLAVAELVVAPFAEPLEDRVEPLLGMLLEVAVDGDVAGVADLLGEVGRVVDELRLEVGVLLRLGQEAEIDADVGLAQRVVDEAGVAGLVAAHVAEELADVGVLAAALHLLVEHAAGELGGERGDEEVGELLAQLGAPCRRSRPRPSRRSS
jgi:hypothetical protein